MKKAVRCPCGCGHMVLDVVLPPRADAMKRRPVARAKREHVRARFQAALATALEKQALLHAVPACNA